MISGVFFDVAETPVEGIRIDEPRGQIGKGGARLLIVVPSEAQAKAQNDDIDARRAGIVREHLLSKVGRA